MGTLAGSVPPARARVEFGLSRRHRSNPDRSGPVMVVVRNRRTSTDASAQASEVAGVAQAQISLRRPLNCVKIALAWAVSPGPKDNGFHVIATGQLADSLHDVFPVVEKFVPHDRVAGEDDQPVSLDHHGVGVGGVRGTDDGRPKIFRDSAVDNLQEFFERFRHLNIRSNEQLDQLVDLARRVVKGVEPESLRQSTNLRQQIATQLSGVQSVLDGLLVDRPRRKILRRPK